MSRALKPFTPLQDLEARRLWAGPVVAGVLTDELADFCQSGLSVILAANDGRGWPIAGHAVACRITPEGAMRIIMREPANVALLAALDRRSPVAATFSEPRTHRSIQVKAPRAVRVAVDDEDRQAAARQTEHFRDELVFINYTRQFADHFCAYRDDELAAIAFRPVEAYVQTPGPGAGEQLA